MSERQLLVMRHGKADYPDGVADHERTLTSRGLKDALEAGEWLSTHGLVPELVLCSDATRTRQTAAEVVAGTGAADVPVLAVSDLYESHVGEVLEAVQRVPADTTRVMVVGHEPTMSATVAALTGSYVRFGTATLAVLDYSGAWDGIEPDGCSLDQVRNPS